jgi:HEAT repeat protein
MAASALESIGPGAAAATSALAKSLRDDEDWEMRWRAAKALGAIGPRARISLPFLRDALKDESPWTRLAAADALWEVDRWDSGTLSVLIELVEGVLNFTRRP